MEEIGELTIIRVMAERGRNRDFCAALRRVRRRSGAAQGATNSRATVHIQKNVRILQTSLMTQATGKYDSAISDAVTRLISRAENARGLATVDLRPRVDKALGKYLFHEGQTIEHKDVTEFVDEIRADDLCL